MEGSLANELYSDTLQLSKLGLGPISTASSKQSESHVSPNIPPPSTVLDPLNATEIGYRDGLMMGKEASAQEGFNIGFKESMSVGSNWGFVRGVTSALACLLDGLRERLVGTQEKRNKFLCLYESVHSLSTTSTLKLFNDELTNKSVEHTHNAESSSRTADLHDQRSDGILLENYYKELQSLILESPALKMDSEIHQ
ncbi:unnamed protein product [Ilex paraguariensis]|uniref:Essential protein Yae1 N-terminal domain-containing protein n=1 Tax=Ilex paraguariensis TaxID=185542 RepID=A0ABC8TUL2_9AQUA